MNSFVSFSTRFVEFLPKIISSDCLHAKWLNTLSYLENCGARKIAACEHPTLVKEEMLKHAAEEFRHAYYLKSQMAKLSSHFYEDYSFISILGGTYSYHYLEKLDVHTFRYLTQIKQLSLNLAKELAYLLVTYIIELRAGELYPIYEEYLRNMASKIRVKCILLEEEEHLKDMESALSKFANASEYVQQISFIESKMCAAWIDALKRELELN